MIYLPILNIYSKNNYFIVILLKKYIILYKHNNILFHKLLYLDLII